MADGRGRGQGGEVGGGGGQPGEGQAAALQGGVGDVSGETLTE